MPSLCWLQDHKEAEYALSRLDTDPVAALQQLRDSAQGGLKEACCELGRSYLEGQLGLEVEAAPCGRSGHGRGAVPDGGHVLAGR